MRNSSCCRYSAGDSLYSGCTCRRCRGTNITIAYMTLCGVNIGILAVMRVLQIVPGVVAPEKRKTAVVLEGKTFRPFVPGSHIRGLSVDWGGRGAVGGRGVP